jgi:hypothetical protein
MHVQSFERPAIGARDRTRLISVIGGTSCPRPSDSTTPADGGTGVGRGHGGQTQPWRGMRIGNLESRKTIGSTVLTVQLFAAVSEFRANYACGEQAPRKQNRLDNNSIIIRGPRMLAPAGPSLGRKRPRRAPPGEHDPSGHGPYKAIARQRP